MINLTAEFFAIDGCEKSLKDSLIKMIEPSRNESGCVSYCLYKNVKNTRVFTFHEQFKDQSSFELHCNSAHFKNMIKEVSSLIVDEPKITFLEEV
ncbi:MAG: putative quinol monooxygenase [Turicibacter sp.]